MIKSVALGIWCIFLIDLYSSPNIVLNNFTKNWQVKGKQKEGKLYENSICCGYGNYFTVRNHDFYIFSPALVVYNAYIDWLRNIYRRQNLDITNPYPFHFEK